jgi:hypothetical protein
MMCHKQLGSELVGVSGDTHTADTDADTYAHAQAYAQTKLFLWTHNFWLPHKIHILPSLSHDIKGVYES